MGAGEWLCEIFFSLHLQSRTDVVARGLFRAVEQELRAPKKSKSVMYTVAP